MGRAARRGGGARRNATGVWFENQRVGTLTRATNGAVSFRYAEFWLSSKHAFPVASALPLTQADWQGDPVIAAFDNLLPDAEGELRARIAARVGAGGTDVFSLLSTLGRDCVGALQFLPEGEEPSPGAMEYRVIDDTEMVSDLGNLASAPLGLGEDVDFRISIAGAQEKTAYLRVGERWAKPRGTTPTSHIFKTPMGVLPGPEAIDLSDSVENELFCMTLARAIGLPAARVERIILPGQVALSVERFDRTWDGDVLRRLPQEDLCQSLGYPSVMKYQRSGGPGIRDIMDVLRESDRPVEDRETFFRAQLFFLLIGATDGHAKNFSLRLGSRGRFTLAPLYDILSLAPVVRSGRLQRKRYRLAMSIAGRYGVDEIVPRHIEEEGRACGLPKGRATWLLTDLCSAMEPALMETDEALRSTVSDDLRRAISDDARERAKQMLELL